MKTMQNLKYSKIKIIKPIELHDKDVIDLQELYDEIETISSIGGMFANSVYVYHIGFNYPDSRHFHYFNADKISKYILSWSARYGKIAKIKLNEKGMEFEPIKKVDAQILDYDKVLCYE